MLEPKAPGAGQNVAPRRLAARAAYDQIENRIELPAVDPSVWAAAKDQDPPTIGISRELPAGEGAWETLPDGRRVWRIALHSSGAEALRVHFQRFAVDGGEVWLYAPEQRGTDVDGPYSGHGIYGDGDFWSGIIRSDAVVVEYHPAPERWNEIAVPFRLAALAHLISDGTTSDSKQTGPTPSQTAAPCHLDFKCYPQYANHGRAVARITVQRDDGRSGGCSGSLITTRHKSGRPYFLTANHCVSSESEARSVIAFWSEESSACNGPPPSVPGPQVRGAHFVAGAGFAGGDFSLLLLSDLPPGRVVLAGSNPKEIPMGSPVVGIHHPAGSYKRISFGRRVEDRSTKVLGSEAPADHYYQVRMVEGRTEGGSSGSPLFDPADAIVLGVASYGPPPPPGWSVCDIVPFTAGYGRFSVMYPVLRPFLEDEPAPELAVTPTMLAFSGVVGGPASPVSSNVRLSTTSPSTITVTASASHPWIRLSRTSFPISAGASASVTIGVDASTLLTPGSYSGLVTFRSGTAAPKSVSVSLDLAPGLSNVIVTADPNPVYQEPADEEGYMWRFTLRLTETSGVSTRLTSMTAGDRDYSDKVIAWFGTDQIPAYGALSVSLRSGGFPVPSDVDWKFSGRDLARGTEWSRSIVVQLRGPRSSPEIRVTSVPGTVVQNPGSAECPWSHRVDVTETAGVALTLNRWVAGGHDLSGDISRWFGSNRLKARGSLSARLCWKSLFVPRFLTFEVGGTDDLGRAAWAEAQVQFVGPPLKSVAVTVSPAAVAWRVDAGQDVSGRIQLQGDAPFSWTGRISYTTAKDGWLRVYPLSGTGATDIHLVASSQGLPAGRHAAVLQVEAPGATPNQFEVPIELTVSAAPADGPSFTAESVVNAASFSRGLAPGMLFSIFGERLAEDLRIAGSIPLPTRLGKTVVRANGIECPLHFVSPGQVNAQLPFEVPAGSAIIRVEVDGKFHSRTVEVTAIAPGLFTFDGSRPTPHFEGKRGQILVCYITGAGLVSPGVPTGEAPPANRPIEFLPRIVAPLVVEVGGVRAPVLFAGIPPYVVGAAQINYMIPAGAPPGQRSLVVRVGGSVTNTGWINVLE